jgi:hypothetical protein
MPAMLSTGRRVRRFAIALTLMLAAPASLRDAGAQPAAQPAYVGSAACGSCHAREHAAWRSSQHAQAMAEASERTVLGDFADARFTHAGATSRFFRRDGRYVVRTDGPGGKPVDVEVRYTFGVYPLQQYLVALPGGRLQALGIAWDARPKANGGQRWFHLYPPEGGRRAALDRPRPELELPVRRLPLDRRAQELRRGDEELQDHVVGDQRRVRSLPRPGRAARRVGEGR